MAKVFNLVAAKNSGMSDDDIRKFLTSNPNLSVKSPLPQLQQAQPKGNALTALIPVIASILGGVAGAPLGPAGIIGGSAVGSGIGEFGRQQITGEKSDGGKILGETALGAFGGGLGTLFRGGRAATAVGKVAKGAVPKVVKEGNVLTRLGQGMRESVAKPVLTKTIAKTSPRYSAEKAAINKFRTGRYSGTSVNQGKQLNLDYEARIKDIQKLIGKKDKPIDGLKLAVKTIESASEDVDVTGGIGKTIVGRWSEKISSAKGTQDLNKLNKEILSLMKGASPEKFNVLQSVQKQIGNELKRQVPATKPSFKLLSQMNRVAPTIRKGEEAVYRIPIVGAKIPTTPVQALKEITGKGLIKSGQVAERFKTPLSLGAGQSGARLMGGGGQAGYEAEPQISPESAYGLNNAPEETGLNITAQDVAIARLTLPDKQADALEAAYKLLSGDDEKDLTEAQMARKQAGSLTSQALTMLRSNPNLNTGMIGGPLEQLKSKFSAADPATLEFNTLISNITATLAKARAGTSFTPNEEKMLKQYAPAIGDSRQQLETKLSLLEMFL